VKDLGKADTQPAFSQLHLRESNQFGLQQEIRRGTKWELLTRLEGKNTVQEVFAAPRWSRREVGTAQHCLCGSQTSTCWHLTHASCRLNTSGTPSRFVKPPYCS